MKQHISLQQWDEITHDQKNKLDDYGCRRDWKMTIGQMIWFLKEKDCISRIYFTCVDEWCVRDNALNEKDKKELCDALWEAVKEKLNKE